MHSRKNHFKPDPVCAVDSIGENITIKNGDVMCRNVIVCVENLVHTGNCNLCVWGNPVHGGRNTPFSRDIKRDECTTTNIFRTSASVNFDSMQSHQV